MHLIADASVLPVLWWKSSRSDSAAQCVECGIVDPAARVLAVRDSKDPSGPALLLSYRAMNAFTSAL
ncbi:DUF397 domain-containing protein [Streptomyces sp. NPDC049954]|uniref:DUF397 domain-containing protein n=1 Tax=Streptomyces sp. NPDC049954 TaxID=3155779 RepID=UPI00341A0BF7